MHRRTLRSLLVASAGSLTLAIAGSADAQPRAIPAGTPTPAACTPKTTCDGDGGYYAATDDRDKLAQLTDPILKDLRACLDAAGGRHVKPAVAIRFDDVGKPVSHRVEAPGYESLPCVAQATAKLAALQSARETAIRCEYDCPKAKPAAPPPVVVTPPVQPQQPAQPAQPQQPAQPEPPRPPPPRYEKVWYGYQTLILDAGSVALVASGIAAKESGLVWAGAGTFVLGPPIVHFVHGNIGPGFGSFGLRLLVPPTALAIGLVAGLIIGTEGKDGWDTATGALSGAAVGAIVGSFTGLAICIAIDAAALAWDKEKVEGRRDDPLRTRVAKAPQLSLTPTMDIRPDRAVVGVGGSF